MSQNPQPQPPSTPAPASQAKPHWVFSPQVTIISLVIGVLGTAWGFVSYFLSVQEPELSYALQPVQARLVELGATSRLTVSHDGKPIKSEINALQIAIWNEGRKAVTSDEVLEPVVLHVSSKVTLLEASVREVSRKVTAFELDRSESNPSAVALKFRILEPGDGAMYPYREPHRG